MNDGSISRDLDQFLGAYFHQDWDLEAEDWEGVVDSYVKARPVARALCNLAQEIDNLRQARAEPDLEQFLVNSVGVDYLPDPLTYTEWLGQIADRLRTHAAMIDERTASER
ncbi:contact-dependent growth inhibition system immunity protein [Mycolicibacterium confluentis]|uniref:Uncharacterized protein n=1 Tax=Mycolicibacterium confluentis TaxID=28047 RepID=A0A7I7XZW8_9MYCO|nr:contact-dependent growth inhibition system immunity protein [Mycolicibacterium confluentis]MCV7319465.1 hypothetical protein [Mycolicibacterium confluentis]ORV34101.1 hypothetical protein AWB99_00100 [Mycolicibacterium confluentis]BBZ34483.1 hypothetical protein MCNF_30880 [Mycolicibacterium confluentis]